MTFHGAFVAASFAVMVYALLVWGPEHERSVYRRRFDACSAAYADRGRAVVFEKCGVRP